MEVDDGASEDSDATVAGEEGLASGENTMPLQNRAVAGVVSGVAAAAAQPTGTESRASDGDSDAGPASPSLLHGHTAPNSHFESQAGNFKYVFTVWVNKEEGKGLVLQTNCSSSCILITWYVGSSLIEV